MKQNDSKTTSDQVKSLMFSLFENIVSFNTFGTTAICEKVSPDFDFLPQLPVRVIAEDLLCELNKRLIAEKGNDLSSLLLGSAEVRHFNFRLLINGEYQPCMGVSVPVENGVLFCFNGVKDAMKLFNIIPEEPVPDEQKHGKDKVFIRTFGFFEVFANGKPVRFHSAKAKELLALLVDRRGGYVSCADSARILWPDEEPSQKQNARFRKTVMRLAEQLKESGIENIMESAHGKHRIVMQNIDCDLYRYLQNGGKADFHGVYMSNYPWGSEAKSAFAAK